MNLKRKHVVAIMFFICLLLCNLNIVQGKRAQASSIRLTYKSITVVKGQYVCIGLKGASSSAKITWSVSGKNLKVHETGKNGGMGAYCCINAIRTGTGTLNCIVNKRTLKCRIKVLSDAEFVGDFCDSEKEVYLSVFKNGRQYVAMYRQFRLCEMGNLTGNVKNSILTLKGSDPSGKPITVAVSRKGKKRIFTFRKTTWEYFTQGNTVALKKCSGRKTYKELICGYHYHD